MSDNELGDYLRTRREAVTPAEVGLPTGPRRRTPGLRRSELATLAGVSVEYLTRLEQGRDRNPSPPVITALANTLKLAADEHVHLFRLSKAHHAGAATCASVAPPTRIVRPTIQALLTRFEPGPAVVLNRLTDILAHTSGFERLARPVGILDADQPNLLRYTFTDPRARTGFPDWEKVADELMARLKAEILSSDTHAVHLAEELTEVAGEDVTRRLRSPLNLAHRPGVERWAHPEVGPMRLAYETLMLTKADDQYLIAYLPADDDTSQALDKLTGQHPGGLRAVN